MAFALTPVALTPAGNVLGINVNGPKAASDYTDALNSYNFVAPSGVGQIDAFAFSYQTTNEVTLENEITDHWLENNTAVQDQIGIKPVMVTLRGYVAELVLQVSVISQVLAGVESALSQADAYLGKYTPGATDALLTAITQAQNVEIQVQQALSRAAAIANLIPGFGPNLTKQQQAFSQLAALRDARILFTVYTPFQVYYNMAIMRLTAVQPEKTQGYSDFSVTMKQLQFVGTPATGSAGVNAGRFQAQVQVGAASSGLTTAQSVL